MLKVIKKSNNKEKYKEDEQLNKKKLNSKISNRSNQKIQMNQLIKLNY